MISLITTGRDDDFGVGFLARLKSSIEHNISMLENFNVEYEYIISEWNPIRNYISENKNFKEIFKNEKVKNVIASQSVSEKEGLNTTIFFEYFAKNIGVRQAKYDNILLINSDIIISEKCFEKIINYCVDGLSKERFYRARHRGQYDDNFNILTIEDCHYPNNPDAIICGYCSGDFLFLHKDVFVNIAKGYDETNPSHRISFQSGMDGEILWNLHKKNVHLEFIDEIYYHINHGHPNQVDNVYNTIGYDNKDNWGFIDYTHTKIKNNVIVIS
jgi:hypothetical protein